MSKEITVPGESRPLYNGFVTVIADDQEYYRTSTNSALLKACSLVNLRPGSIFLPNTFSEFINYSMTSKSGRPADVVLVDHEFYTDYKAWEPDLSYLSNSGSRLGVDISSFTPSLPDFMHRPSSVSLALWLRILGYNNSIFIVSTEFIPADQIANKVLELAKQIPIHQPAFPIDGYVLKESAGGRMHFASRVKKGVFGFGNLEWDRKNFDGDLSEGLKRLIRR